ncbi:unnamed protein product [Heligmosomoides polygyrus]|uniref:Endo/exonuclease/phosphatase domain-containing protein n=1 Tax=Heligmosomoides polygyrus TaxID=6339 RepID=A0A183G8Q8_HELPZ|nr:unnamed protein product [Heligmosomoides polygyrus]
MDVIDETWKRATDAIRQAARLELGTTKPGVRSHLSRIFGHCFTEAATKHRTETIRWTDHNEHLITGAKVNRKNIDGVGFLVNLTVHHLVDSYKITSPRVTVLRLQIKDQEAISIINGYAPTSAATDEEREEFYKLFERTVNDEKGCCKVVVGEFNATVDTNDHDEWRLGPHETSSRNENEAFKPAMDMGRPKWRNTFGDRPCSYKQTLESVRRLRAALI